MPAYIVLLDSTVDARNIIRDADGRELEPKYGYEKVIDRMPAAGVTRLSYIMDAGLSHLLPPIISRREF